MAKPIDLEKDIRKEIKKIPFMDRDDLSQANESTKEKLLESIKVINSDLSVDGTAEFLCDAITYSFLKDIYTKRGYCAEYNSSFRPTIYHIYIYIKK